MKKKIPALFVPDFFHHLNWHMNNNPIIIIQSIAFNQSMVFKQKKSGVNQTKKRKENTKLRSNLIGSIWG